MTKQISSILFAICILVSHYTLVLWYDVTDMRRTFTTLLGIIGLAICVHAYKMSWLDHMTFIPFWYMLARTMFNWVPGYSIYQMTEIFGVVGIVLTVSRLDIKWVVRAVAVTIILQASITYFHLITWKVPLYLNSEHVSIFGSVRHGIRYSTIIFAGLIASVKMIGDDNRFWKVVAVICILVGIPTLIHAYSNTVVFITVICALLMMLRKYGKKVTLITLIVLAAVTLFIRPDGFWIDDGRLELWTDTTQYIIKSCTRTLFGPGAGSWELVGNTFHTHGGHPHNEIINIVFDYGLTGFFICIIVLVLYLTITAWASFYVCLGLLGITLSFLTNSMRYPDMSFTWALFMGLAMAEMRKYEILDNGHVPAVSATDLQ